MSRLSSESLVGSIGIEDSLRMLLINISGISSFATSLSTFSSSKFVDGDEKGDTGEKGVKGVKGVKGGSVLKFKNNLKNSVQGFSIEYYF